MSLSRGVDATLTLSLRRASRLRSHESAPTLAALLGLPQTHDGNSSLASAAQHLSSTLALPKVSPSSLPNPSQAQADSRLDFHAADLLARRARAVTRATLVSVVSLAGEACASWQDSARAAEHDAYSTGLSAAHGVRPLLFSFSAAVPAS